MKLKNNKTLEKIFIFLSKEEEKEYEVEEITTSLISVILIKKKSNEGFFFNTQLDKKKLYNNEYSFLLSDENFKVKINEYYLKRHNELNCYNFQSENYNEFEKYYYSFLIPIDSIFFISNIKRNIFKPSSCENSDFSFQIEVNEVDVRVQIISVNGDCLNIKTNSKVNFAKFNHLVNSIIKSLEFLTGNLITGNRLFLHSVDKHYEKDVEFLWEYRKKIKCKTGLFPFSNNCSNDFQNLFLDGNFDFKKYNSKINDEEFESLVSLVFNNDNYYSSLIIMSSVFNSSSLIKPILLFSILEILCKDINENNENKNSKISLRENALEILEKYEGDIKGEDFEELKEAILAIKIDYPTNAASFEKAISSLGIKLSNKDSLSLKMRNHLFHGSFIKESFNLRTKMEMQKLDKEYYSLTQRIYSIISKIILKKIKFNGHVINHHKLRETQSKKNLQESYFYLINN